MEIQRIQTYLAEHNLDGWLLADFHGRNTIAMELLELNGLITRRSFYFIPATGEPVAIVHAIEQDKFASVPGIIKTYSSYIVLEQELQTLLQHVSTLAMEYSPRGRLPYIGLVDAGTIELVKSFGIEIVSSADIVAFFQACLTVEQIATHRLAARNLIEIKDNTFDFIRSQVEHNTPVTEFDVVQFVLKQFDEYDMTTTYPPLCAVNANAGNPHYEPQQEASAVIQRGNLVLLDLWAKLKQPQAVYGDITWMCFTGTREELPEKYQTLFTILVKARDAAISFIRTNIEKQPVYGAQVDDVCRKVIADAGYGQYFTHRTGHSITTSEHGPGPNIDNLETEDNRKLRKGHLFSIEPGIYMDDCGFRTEINMLISHNGAEVTTLPLQNEITTLFL